MHICVCVKQTPDSNSVYIDPISGQVDAERFVQILNPADACAVEAAVRWSPQATEWGPFTVATALAAYIKREVAAPNLILCGETASDWSSGIVGPALAEQLDLPQITGVMQLNALQDEDTVRLQVTRKLERGYRELLEAQPPLLITITPDLNEPRYPSLPAHLAALKARIPVLDPQTLAVKSLQEESEETTLLEMHTPRPRPRRITAPNSRHSAFERIGEIVAGGATGRQTRLVEGSNEELARALVQFLRERGFL